MKFLGNGITIDYEFFGPEGAPVVVLSHSLGSSSIMWAPQLPQLTKKFRVLCYDTRGHGGTSAPEGAYNLDQLGDDALALLDGMDLPRVHWVGLSMGGMIGQNLALRQNGRFKSLTLCDTSSQIPQSAWPIWDDPAGGLYWLLPRPETAGLSRPAAQHRSADHDHRRCRGYRHPRGRIRGHARAHRPLANGGATPGGPSGQRRTGGWVFQGADGFLERAVARNYFPCACARVAMAAGRAPSP